MPEEPTVAAYGRLVELRAVRGDITRVDVDVVVNAANPGLLGGGGVDGAIHRAGGPDILAECRALTRDLPGGRLPRGSAVATTAGRLPARWVVHTAGPIWSASEDRSEVLRSCYRESLRLADGLGARTVAFPAISAGIYGWPIADAARQAVAGVREVTAEHVQEVLFVLFDDAVLTAFEDVVRQ
jgi:O-acetyl-ADP-ribose deacetylase (regulator of RNase III)